MSIIEIEHVPLNDGKRLAAQASKALTIPAFRPELASRWEAIYTGDYNPDADMAWAVKEILGLVPTLNDITTQRAIYYMLRGKFPGRKFRGNDLGSDKFYTQLTQTVMEKVQLAANITMQSMGIWAAPRGYIAGDGNIYTWKRGRIPLTAQPTLQFDLCDVDVSLNSHARKVIHFEKDAGFGGIVSGDMPKYIEAIFSTSQGQLSESANKFLRQCEDWGLQVYSIHDADPFGIQMNLMYGMSSKASAYMSDGFYPKRAITLGFYPSIARLLKLPPEKITPGSTEHGLFSNLNQLSANKPDLESEVKTMMGTLCKWEFQALNAIDEKAPQIYIIEGLRANGDKIKFVPDGETIKKQVLEDARNEAENIKERAISRAITAALETTRDKIEAEIRESCKGILEEFDLQVEEVIGKLDTVDPDTYRESVKAELVSSPSDYWDSAANRISHRSFNFEVDIQTDIQVDTKVNSINPQIATKAIPPEIKDRLYLDDIVNSIESKVMKRMADRTRVVDPIRKSFEEVFGEPDQEW